MQQKRGNGVSCLSPRTCILLQRRGMGGQSGLGVGRVVGGRLVGRGKQQCGEGSRWMEATRSVSFVGVASQDISVSQEEKRHSERDKK